MLFVVCNKWLYCRNKEGIIITLLYEYLSFKKDKFYYLLQKQPPRGVLRKTCSENIQQIYRRTPMPKCDFNKVEITLIEITLRHGCSPVNLRHIFRIAFLKNSSGRLLLFLLIGASKCISASTSECLKSCI